MDSHVEVTTPDSNKIVRVNDYRSLCILTKSASNVVYKDKRVARNKKKSQYIKSPYVDINKLRKFVNKVDVASQYSVFKKDGSQL